MEVGQLCKEDLGHQWHTAVNKWFLKWVSFGEQHCRSKRSEIFAQGKYEDKYTMIISQACMFKENIIASYLQIKTPVLEKTNALSKNRVEK